MTNNKTLEMALEYAAAGFRVLPLSGKSPLAGSHGYKDATTDPVLISEWFSNNPNTNLGIAVEQLNGKHLVVVDLDVEHDDGADGVKTLSAWEAQNGKLPETLTVKTGSGGYHCYYYTDKEYRNGTNILQGFNGLEKTGVDIRGERGGYLVAPPSVHPETGESYEWIDGFDVSRIADGGEALDKLLTYRSNTKKAQASPIMGGNPRAALHLAGKPARKNERQEMPSLIAYLTSTSHLSKELAMMIYTV